MNFVGEWFSKNKTKSGNITVKNLPEPRHDKYYFENVEVIIQKRDEFRVHTMNGVVEGEHYYLHNWYMFIHLENGDDELEGLYITHSDTGIVQVKKVTCQGCLEDQPNQLAHMEMGGCCYSEN